MAPWLVCAGAGVIGLLGLVHMVYTYRGTRMWPRDPALVQQMQAVPPRISASTTMWRAWIGFNASHSLGALLFGAVYGYLALAAPQLLFASPFLVAVGAATLATYLWLGWRYWFHVPFTAIAIACALYAAGVAAAWSA